MKRPILALMLCLLPAAAKAAPFPVKVVVVTTFELGADTGDAPGEFQAWAKRLPLPETIAAPGTEHGHMRLNRKLGVLGIVTGEGPEHAASAMTALALDPRFDLRHAYIMLAGIGGIDPNFGTAGSAVWAPHVINAGLAHTIDTREIPKNWPDGTTPIEGATPDMSPTPPLHSLWGDQAYTIDPALLDWAYGLTKDITLPDSANLQQFRARYTGFPAAQRAPSVQLGDVIAGPTFWVGALENAHAERWVKYWTQGHGVMGTTSEEDLGFFQALDLQSRAGRVDMHRVLILRTASNFDMPAPGQSAADMLAAETHEGGYSGFHASLDAAYIVGSRVVREITDHWDRYADHAPGQAPSHTPAH